MDEILGSIMLWSSSIIPRGWMVCDGRRLLVAQNSALFSLIGNRFGGDGKVDFYLPDLRGRVPRGVGTSTQLGTSSGQETVTLTMENQPSHQHPLMAASMTGNATSISNAVLATAGTAAHTPVPPNIYGPTGSATVQLAATSVGPTGGQSHENMQPYTVINFIMCVTGHYPSRP